VGKLGLLLVIAFAAAACGGGTTTTETVVHSQTVVETATVQSPPTSTEAATALSSRTFQLPSRNIGCATSEGVLVCDILSGLKPMPRRACELDWTGMEMETLGPAQPRCAGDTAYDQSARVLAYGNTWRRGGFRCSSAKTGLRCRNKDGRGFSLSRETWKRF
jgi:hypothetical protein